MNEPEHSVREIFAEALEIADAEKRSAYLAQACGADARLRREVEELLQAEADAGEFLPDQPAGMASRSALEELVEEAKPFGPLPDAPISEGPGDRVGRYVLLEKLGEGGCGVVYLAWQETPVRRQVALKIIKPGMDTRQVIARFEAERQALARMDHPHIAKVLDAGATDTGRPYFVMELVRGTRITDYCNQHRLSTRERLELFIQVCQAVQHAHQKGIIHRDLKPSNVLVAESDGVPVPKVIDFGIAKATEGKLTDQTLFTAFEQFLGTPAYMSPEQAAMTNVDIDTRSDIYSLGVLLYELLTGSTPFDTKELLALGVDELRRTIREKAPPRPSTRLTHARVAADARRLKPDAESRKQKAETDGASSRRLLQEVRGDLDWIVMKCLEKDRARRYATANGLASDLRRHLNNEPVIARPPSRLYEFQKTVRRHKVGFAATAAVIVVLVAGVVTSIWQAVRATNAKREALASQAREAVQRDKAEAGERKAVEAQASEAKLRALAQAEELSARQRAYTADMNVVQQAWDEGKFRRAQTILTNYVPKPGEPDLRGFEWRYLWKLCQDESRFSFTNFSGKVRMALSPDGRFIAAGSGHTIKLLDYVNRRELDELQLPDGSGQITALGFLPADTNGLATLSCQTLHFWDLARKRVTGTLTLSNPAVALAFSRDGKLLAAVGGYGGTVELWRVHERSLVWSRTGPAPGSEPLWGLAFAPDGNSLVTGGGSRAEPLVWDLASGTASSFPIEHRGSINAFALSPDGQLLATSCNDATVILWDLAQRKSVARLIVPSSGAVGPMAFSPDGRWLVTGNADATVRVWDVATGQQKTMYRGHQFEVYDVAFSPDGRFIISSGWEAVKVWDLERRSPETILTTNQSWVRTSLFSPNSQQLITRALGVCGLTVWDVPTRSLVRNLTLPFPDGTGPSGFSPDGRTLVLVADHRIALWDAATFTQRGLWTNDFGPSSLSFSPDDRTLAVSGLQGASTSILDGITNRLTFWDLTTQRRINKLSAAGPFAVIAKFSHDGKRVAIGYLHGEVRVWDFETERPLTPEFRDQAERIWAVAFSPDDAWLAAGGWDGTVSFYDLHTMQAFRSIQTSTWTIGLCFAPDGKTVASADGDGTIKLWNVATREIALVLKGHIGALGVDPSFSSDGKYLATSGADGTVRLWPAATLEEIGTPRKSTLRDARK